MISRKEMEYRLAFKAAKKRLRPLGRTYAEGQTCWHRCRWIALRGSLSAISFGVCSPCFASSCAMPGLWAALTAPSPWAMPSCTTRF